MASRTKKSAKNIRATRSLRSNGPAIGGFLGDSATSGQYWTGKAPGDYWTGDASDLNGGETHRSPVGTSVTEQAVATGTQLPSKVKIRGRAKVPEAQPHPVAAVDIYSTHRQVPLANAGRQTPPQATVMLEVPGPGARTSTMDSPVGVGQNDIDITVPEGQGLLVNMEVDDSDIEYVHLETRIRGFSDAESLIPPGGFLNTEGVPGKSIPVMEVLHIEQYSNARYWQFAPYLEREFCTRLEHLYKPNDQGRYDVGVDDLKRTRTALERSIAMKRLVVRHDKPSLQLAQNDEAMEETPTAHTVGLWEQYIMDHLISNCDVGGLEPIEETSSSDCADSELESDEYEPALVAHSTKEKRRSKQKEKQDPVGTHLGVESTGKEETPSCIKRVKLSREDLQVAIDLWDTVINPTCIEFEKRTGKPAEAMREAIAGVIARRVNQRGSWNAWQKIWWKRLPNIHDKAVRKQLGAQCREEYRSKANGLDTQDAIDAWMRSLEHDLAELHDLDGQANAAAKVNDIEEELINISSRAARDHIHVLFFVCSVNPYSIQAQAMSGVGVGSKEMRSALVSDGQLPSLHLMLNDMRTKVGNLELENRKAGILPPAFGSGGMLKPPERTGTEWPNPLTKFKLFECTDVVGPSGSIPKAHNQAAPRSCKTQRVNDNSNESDDDHSTAKTVQRLSPLLINDALARAVSQVQLPMDGWVSLHVFRLFVVLVEPPPGLDLGAIEGLPGYLTKLLLEIGGLVKNGTREILCHCWWALMMLCDHGDGQRKRADWIPILKMLKRAKKRLINWCPSVSFPIDGAFPRARETVRNMVKMFFNPDPARPITDLTPIIVNPAVPGGNCLACTVARTTITVDPSTVLGWCQPLGAVRAHGPDPTPQSAVAAPTTAPAAIYTTFSTSPSASAHSATGVGLLPMTQALNIPSTDPLRLGPDFPMDPGEFGAFDSSYLFPILPESVWGSGAAARPYENDMQNLPFNPLTTLEPTTSTFLPPSNMGMFNPHHARANFTTATATAQSLTSSLPSMSRKRGPPPVSVHDEGIKRRKVGQHLVSQQVGARRGDHRSTAVTNAAANMNPNDIDPFIGLPAANQRLTKAITPPIAAFSRPEGMSSEEYVEMLEAKLSAEREAVLEYMV